MRKYVGLKLASVALLAILGCSGDKGDKGDPGEPGEAGPEGPPGPTGPSGSNGQNGEGGANGQNGEGGSNGQNGEAGPNGSGDQAAAYTTKTKIKHVVVIFGENISFDHYFGTYPNAANATGEVPFGAAANTPNANNLVTPLDVLHSFAPLATTDAGADGGAVDLLHSNPNNDPNSPNDTGANAGNQIGANPFRLARVQSTTQDMNHNYGPEQSADNGGAMNAFPAFTGTAPANPANLVLSGSAAVPPLAEEGTKQSVMAYFDGNTVGALWNYAQNYALNDNSFTTNFGPSTPGAINLVSGQTNGFAMTNNTPLSTSHAIPDGNGNYTLIGDIDPLNDVCSTATDQGLFAGKNVGDLLNTAGVSWGFFQGGFDLTATNANGTTGCQRSSTTTTSTPGTTADYVPHHQPFQYYTSTANPKHFRPSSVTAVGHTFEEDGTTHDPANHQYDTHDFFDAIRAGNFPAVSYLKAPAFQDGHAGYSNPQDEQNFIQQVVAVVQESGDWDSTAIIFSYDDSDGWYDHQAPPIVNPSTTSSDTLNGAGTCNSGAQQNGAAPTTPLKGNDGNPAQGRCGYGTRIPLLVVSPYAKKNYVDHTLTDQTSILKFVEDNWLDGQRIQAGGSFDTIAGSIENMFSF
jgi:phospholipase C